jgi:hypothetical protein
MSIIVRWDGPYAKGAMKVRHEKKRQEAEARNRGGSVTQGCGHKHGPLQVSRCDK